MLDILSSTKPVLENLTEVKIIEGKIDQWIKGVKPEELKTPVINYARFQWSPKELIRLIFIFNAINFCYWAKRKELKWAVEIMKNKLKPKFPFITSPNIDSAL